MQRPKSHAANHKKVSSLWKKAAQAARQEFKGMFAESTAQDEQVSDHVNKLKDLHFKREKLIKDIPANQLKLVSDCVKSDQEPLP